jgi:hypothetical protein
LAERRRQTGAGKGTRSKKSGQSIFFEGYKKHSLYVMVRVEDKWRPLPLCSSVRPANVSEQRVIHPLLHFVLHCVKWPVVFVVTDQGYINGPLAGQWRRRWQVAHIVRPRKKMVPPAGAESDGCPLCPLGDRLVWEDYDIAAECLIYRGNRSICRTCPLAGTCPKQFEFPSERHETFWGMVPPHSRLARRILRQFRPRVEPGFNLLKNRYGVTGFFINSRHLAQTLCLLSDVLETLDLLAQERPARGRETRRALIRDIFQPELWD